MTDEEQMEMFNSYYMAGYPSRKASAISKPTYAEPREKQIQIDAEHIRALQKQNGELTDKVKEFEAQINRAFDVLTFKRKRIAELEAQIEKMKCCSNCKHSRTEYEHCKTDKHEKWEIKEK